MNSDTYEVHLEVFEGPLDLLLYLIKKDDLDITNIPISRITREYLDYLELMKDLNLDIAGDFLVMASTLMQIKARSLLPSQEEGTGEEGPDPRSELVQKLQEYQKFKEAAKSLQERGENFSNVFYRGTPNFAEADKSLNIRIFDLLSTLRDILDRAEDDGRVVQGEEFPIEKKMEKILAMLAKSEYVTLRDLFEGERKRRAILACFLALLELIKTQRIFARQGGPFADILIYKREPMVEPLPQIWPEAEVALDPLPEPAPPLPVDDRPSEDDLVDSEIEAFSFEASPEGVVSATAVGGEDEHSAAVVEPGSAESAAEVSPEVVLETVPEPVDTPSTQAFEAEASAVPVVEALQQPALESTVAVVIAELPAEHFHAPVVEETHPVEEPAVIEERQENEILPSAEAPEGPKEPAGQPDEGHNIEGIDDALGDRPINTNGTTHTHGEDDNAKEDDHG